VGFGVHSEAGFAPEGVSAMFEKLQQANRFNDTGAFPYLRSHPLTSERIAEARARSQHAHAHAPAPARAGLPGQAWHALMAGRARALGQPSAEALQGRLQEARQLSAAAPTGQALSVLYAAAWAAAQLRDAGAAQDWLQRLRARVGGDVLAEQAVRQLSVEQSLLLGRPAEAVARAAAEARARHALRFVEVECDTMDQVRAILALPEGTVDMVLLDNMRPDAIAVAVAARDAAAPGVLLEASGGIALDDVAAYAAAGVDRISIGALTHSAPCLDVGLDIDAGT